MKPKQQQMIEHNQKIYELGLEETIFIFKNGIVFMLDPRDPDYVLSITSRNWKK